MSREYETRIVRLLVAPKADPIFSELATTITIEDEAAGEYVEVEQEGGSTDLAGRRVILITPEEWPLLREAIDRMIGACR